MTAIALPSNPPHRQADRLNAFGVHLLVMRGLCPATIVNRTKIIVKILREIGTMQPDHDQVKQYIVIVHGRVRPVGNCRSGRDRWRIRGFAPGLRKVLFLERVPAHGGLKNLGYLRSG